MPRIATAVGIAVGLVAVIVVYLTFLAHEFVRAGRANVALGIGTLAYVATRPGFLITAVLALVLCLYKVFH